MFLRALRIIRIVSVRRGIPPSEFSLEGWSKKARHYKTSSSNLMISETDLGKMEDFLTPYELRMQGDFPFFVTTKKGQELYIPPRTKDELKRIFTNNRQCTKNHSRKLVQRCTKAYFTIPGLGYIGSKYIYRTTGDLIGCKCFFKVPHESETYRILKCIGSDLSTGCDRAIFRDHSITRNLNDEELQRLGYSKIMTE